MIPFAMATIESDPCLAEGLTAWAMAGLGLPY